MGFDGDLLESMEFAGDFIGSFYGFFSGDLVGLGFWGHLMGFSACRPEPPKLL